MSQQIPPHWTAPNGWHLLIALQQNPLTICYCEYLLSSPLSLVSIFLVYPDIVDVFDKITWLDCLSDFLLVPSRICKGQRLSIAWQLFGGYDFLVLMLH